MMLPLKDHLNALLAEAEEDYLNFSFVIDAARGATDIDPSMNTRDRSLWLLGLLLDAGFQAVDLIEEGKCKPWPDQDRDTILGRIREHWTSSEDEVHVGSIYWFDLPDDRRAAARAALVCW